MKTASRLPLLLLLLLPVLPAQLPAEASPWVLLEQARALIDDRQNPDTGQALRLLRQAIEQQTLFPEAELAIGEIYAREGAVQLAKVQFQKVLQPEFLGALRVPEERFRVRYRLARIQKDQELYADMEKSLQAVLQEQPAWADRNQQRFRDALLRSYLTRGLDRTLTLYRLEGSGFALEAHAELGWFYYRNGRYSPASIHHLLFALTTIVTEMMLEMRRAQPGYEFQSLAQLLRSAAERAPVRDYLRESGFFRVAYYLAAASHAGGSPARAAELWQVVAQSGFSPEVAGRYPELARRQLSNPTKEPPLVDALPIPPD